MKHIRKNKFISTVFSLVLILYLALAAWILGNREPSQPAFVSRTSQAPSATSTPTASPIVVPSQKILSGGVHVFQSFNNCGPASLSMALSFFSISQSQEVLGKKLRPYQNPQGDNDDKSVTVSELAESSEQYGLVSYHRPAGDIETLQKLVALDLPVITRTWLREGEDIGHYRVVKGYNKDTGVIIQDDSLQGKNLSFSEDQFNSLWQAFNYEFLVLVPNEKRAQVEQVLGERSQEVQAWQKALELAQAQLFNNPEDIYAKFNLVVSYYELGQYEKAVDNFEQVEALLPPRMLWYQIEPILAYYHLQNYTKVMAMTQQILNNHNRAFSELHYLRGKIYQKQGQEALAQEAFSLADRYNSTDYWKVNLGDIYEEG